MLLLALVLHLYYQAPSDEQSFPMVMGMIRAGEIREADEFQSPLDELFDRLERQHPEHLSLKYYRYQADVVHGAQLPVHVHFVMAEFAHGTQFYR